MILTGIFTFSLAFYFMIFIYAALCLIKKDKRYIFLIVVLGILFVNIPDIDWGNPMLNNLAERMKITDSGVAGNNRVDNKADERLMTDGKYLFGYGYGVDISHVLSYKQLVLQFGYVGFLFMLFEWLYFALKHNNYRGGGVWIYSDFYLYSVCIPKTSNNNINVRIHNSLRWHCLA